MFLMIAVTACFTVTSLSDKHAVAKLKFNGNELTFFMAAATAIFMLAVLPFDSRLFVMSWQSFVAIILLAVCKMLEFQLAAIILREMSAFELKAWLGATVFFSYAVDLIAGVSPVGIGTLIKFGFIAMTAAGLFMIARSGRGKINYRKIAVPLIFYLLSKFAYGMTVNLTKTKISSTLALFCALVLLAVILLPKAHPIKVIKERPKGTAFVVLTKIPNVLGLVCENAVAARSMADYSFIQPMILAALFFIGIIRREEHSALNVAGGIICIAGIVGFQLLK